MSRVNLSAATIMGPVPAALVSCGTMENANLITIAWTGIICSTPAKTYISVRPERHSYEMLKQGGDFVINLPSVKIAAEVDYCGVKSGADVDKIKQTGLTLSPAQHVKAPIVNECPISIECKIDRIIPLGSHDMFIADIVAVNADSEFMLNEKRIDVAKCDLLGYAINSYFGLNPVVVGTHGGLFKQIKED